MSRAMILAAGVGSRLLPLTEISPKALLKFRGRPMMEHVLQKLKEEGFTDIIVNVHHHADQIEEFIRKNKSFGVSVSFSDERELLMDTGGGILRAKSFFEGRGPFLVHNIDVYSNIDLRALLDKHKESGAIASLAVKQRETSRNFYMDENAVLCGWRNNLTGEEIITRKGSKLKAVAFSGIHVLSDSIFTLIERKGPFSITKAYLELSGRYEIKLVDHSSDKWIDMAHPSNFPELS